MPHVFLSIVPTYKSSDVSMEHKSNNSIQESMQNHRQTPGDAVGDEWKGTGLFYFSVYYFVQLQYDGFSLPCYILFGSILLLSSRNLIFLMRDRKRDGRGRREELGIVKGG